MRAPLIVLGVALLAHPLIGHGQSDADVILLDPPAGPVVIEPPRERPPLVLDPSGKPLPPSPVTRDSEPAQDDAGDLAPATPPRPARTVWYYLSPPSSPLYQAAREAARASGEAISIPQWMLSLYAEGQRDLIPDRG